jgi:hypothetical protein
VKVSGSSLSIYGLANSFAGKRAAAQKAESDFFALLRENKLSAPDLLWKDVIVFPIK